MKEIINGVKVKAFLDGFFGENDEGAQMLSFFGLNVRRVPFDMEDYLQSRSTQFQDIDGNDVKVCFAQNEQSIDFHSEYLGITKNLHLIKEWEHEDIDTIIQLESKAIGDCTCRVLSERSLLDDERKHKNESTKLD